MKSKADRFFIINFCKRLKEFKEYSELTINQSRLLHIYMGLINPITDESKAESETKHDRKKVVILLDDIKKIFDIKNISTFKKDLQTFPNVWHNGTETIKIFETIAITHSQLYQEIIVLKCTNESESYFFDLGDKGRAYVEYPLNAIRKLKSHKYIMCYQMFKDSYRTGYIKSRNNKKTLFDLGKNTKQDPFTLRVETIKKWLSFLSDDKYKTFTDIQNKFLNNCIKSINCNTDIVINSWTIKYNRQVVLLAFTIDFRITDSTPTAPQQQLTPQEQQQYLQDYQIDIDEYEVDEDIPDEYFNHGYTEEMINALEELEQQKRIEEKNRNILDNYICYGSDNNIILKSESDFNTVKQLINSYYDYNKDNYTVSHDDINIYLVSNDDSLNEQLGIPPENPLLINLSKFDYSKPFEISPKI